MVVVGIVIMLEPLMIRNVERAVESHLKDGENIVVSFLHVIICLSNLYLHSNMLLFRYHVPRSWLNPTGNLLVVFEEWGGNPSGISLVRRTTGSVCADIFEGQPTLNNWNLVSSGKEANLQSKAHLWCPPGQKISEIKFASYGLPQGTCGNFREGSCHAHKSYNALQRVKLQVS